VPAFQLAVALRVVGAGSNEACAFLARCHDPTVQTPCILQNSIRGTWVHGDDVVVKHHECQSSVAFEWVFVVEVKNRLLLPFFELLDSLVFEFVDPGFGPLGNLFGPDRFLESPLDVLKRQGNPLMDLCRLDR
jgi:hypothetical protein